MLFLNEVRTILASQQKPKFTKKSRCLLIRDNEKSNFYLDPNCVLKNSFSLLNSPNFYFLNDVHLVLGSQQKLNLTEIF